MEKMNCCTFLMILVFSSLHDVFFSVPLQRKVVLPRNGCGVLCGVSLYVAGVLLKKRGHAADVAGRRIVVSAVGAFRLQSPGYPGGGLLAYSFYSTFPFTYPQCSPVASLFQLWGNDCVWQTYQNVYI